MTEVHTVATIHILIQNIKKSAGSCDEDSKCYMSTLKVTL